MLLARVLAVAGMAGIIISLTGFLTLRLTLTRRLKKQLQQQDEYWDTGTVDFGFVNTAVFAWACTLPSFQRLKKFQAIYPGLNVRAFSNGFERGVACGTIGGAFVFFVCALLFALVNPEVLS